MTQPMIMEGHQVVQTPYGQAFITRSNTTVFNPNNPGPEVYQAPETNDKPDVHVFKQTIDNATNEPHDENYQTVHVSSET